MKVFQKLFVIFLCGMLTLSSQLPVYATEGTTETTPTASGETATVSSSDSENFVTQDNFPDDNFRNYLLQKGIKSKSDVENTKTLDLAGRGIKDLKGIEHFTNLTKLNLKANWLTKLDLSSNTSLGWLDVSQNQLIEIKKGELPSSLEYLVITDNSLTNIDLSNLSELWYLNVSVNHLTSIDLSNNKKLTHLFLFESDWTAYDNEITSLDLSNQEKLDPYFFKKYAHLLEKIVTPQYGYSVSATLIYSNLESDEIWRLDGETVDASGTVLFDGGTLKKVKLSEIETSETVDTQANFLSEQNFPDKNFRDALTQLGITTKEKAETTTTLDLSGRNIENLKGIEYFTKLTKLNLKANNLSTLDLSSNTSLGWLDASQNKLTKIENNQLPSSLKYLVVTDNFLESIALSNLLELWYLNVSVNKLSTIDLTNNTELTHLFLFESDYTTYDNTITELDLRNQKKLDKYFFEKYANMLEKIITPESGDTVSASLLYSNLSSDEVWTLNDEVVNSNEDFELNGGTLKRVKRSEVSTVNVILYANDGTDNKIEQSAIINEETTLNNNTFTRTGYTFLGWSYSKNATKADIQDGKTLNIGEYPTNGKVELYAVWQANTYTVKFHANNGTDETKTQNITYGVKTVLTANNFVYEGKTFVGWATSSSGKVVYQNKQYVSNLVTENNATIDLYAVWADVAYTVSFELNGGTSSSIDSQTVVHNNKVTKPSDPTRTGYTFTGWVDKSTGKSYSFEDGVTSDTTLQATWKANTYTITYNANGGSGSMTSQALTYDVNSTLSKNSFTRAGYEFAGWSLTSTGSVQYKDNASVVNLTSKEGNTVTLYAQWTPITYSLTYQLNGGSISGNPTSYNVTSDTITLNAPTKTGYTFVGWYSDANYTTQIKQITKGSTGNLTLYAKWIENTYTITYNLNGGSVSGNPTSYKVTSSTITLKNPTKSGYTFAGWYSDSKYSSKVTQIAKGSTGNVTLYAKWIENTYTITYNLDGGNVSGNPTSYTVTNSTITLKNPTKSGYTFAGWYSDSKYNTKVTKISKGSTGNVTLYAKWTANTYKITYKLNGGKVSGNPTSYKVTSSTITLKNPTRSGYTFAGWYSDSKYTTKVTKISKGSTGNRTLYAKWTKVSKPSKVTLKSAKNSSKSKVTVSYKSIFGVSGYQVAYSTSSKFTKSTTKYTTSKTISNLKKGKTYYIKVRAYKKDSTGAKIYGSYSKVIKVKITK